MDRVEPSASRIRAARPRVSGRLRWPQGVHSGDALVILLSGGASALMAAPIDGISLADKIETTKLMMASGADIHALNTVRRHLSKVKGGRLAAACVGTTVTLAISDVVGDDLNAIGSGPGVPDATTWADAAAALERFGGDAHLSEVRHLIARGVAGAIPDTPKPGDAALKRSQAMVIGSRMDAMEGARQAALARGLSSDGDRGAGDRGSSRNGAALAGAGAGTDARHTAPGLRDLQWRNHRARHRAGQRRPQPRVCARHRRVDRRRPPRWRWPASAPTASMGHRASPAASSTRRRWRGPRRSTSMAPGNYLAANDSLSFFAPLDDVVRLGRTDTNVGDLQVIID